MILDESDIHISDDWLLCAFPSTMHVHLAAQEISETADWLEIVPGIDSLVVQFDPAILSPDEAAAIFRQQVQNITAEKRGHQKAIELPVCYDAEYAPDRVWLVEKLGLPVSDLADWHSTLDFTVSILGFMPGFAYLKTDQKVPPIGRLANPRQRVPAGSVGIIGNQSCLYSFDSPGGWPLIGRTPTWLFDPGKQKPAFLSAGQRVRFRPITSAEYDDLYNGREK